MKTLTLSGWSQPADALLGLAPSAQTLDYIEHTPQSVLDYRGEYDLIIGWSLGGILARQLLKSGAVKANALVLIASPYQFVRSEHLQEAMPPDMYEQFYANFRDDTKRTASRFGGLLVRGDANANAVKRQLSLHPRIGESAHWLRWLAFLKEYSAQHHDYSALPKTLIIHGAQDAIIDVSQAKRLHEKLGGALHIMPDAGHAPHLHNEDEARRVIAEFVS